MTLRALLEVYNGSQDERLFVSIWDNQIEYEYMTYRKDIPEHLLDREVNMFDVIGMVQDILVVNLK